MRNQMASLLGGNPSKGRKKKKRNQRRNWTKGDGGSKKCHDNGTFNQDDENGGHRSEGGACGGPSDERGEGDGGNESFGDETTLIHCSGEEQGDTTVEGACGGPSDEKGEGDGGNESFGDETTLSHCSGEEQGDTTVEGACDGPSDEKGGESEVFKTVDDFSNWISKKYPKLNTTEDFEDEEVKLYQRLCKKKHNEGLHEKWNDKYYRNCFIT